jgi:hypothetical protein
VEDKSSYRGAMASKKVLRSGRILFQDTGMTSGKMISKDQGITIGNGFPKNRSTPRTTMADADRKEKAAEYDFFLWLYLAANFAIYIFAISTFLPSSTWRVLEGSLWLTSLVSFGVFFLGFVVTTETALDRKYDDFVRVSFVVGKVVVLYMTYQSLMHELRHDKMTMAVGSTAALQSSLKAGNLTAWNEYSEIVFEEKVPWMGERDSL